MTPWMGKSDYRQKFNVIGQSIPMVMKDRLADLIYG